MIPTSIVAGIICLFGVLYLARYFCIRRAARQALPHVLSRPERVLVYVQSDQRVDLRAVERAIALVVDREGPGWQAIDYEAELHDGAWRHAVLCMRRTAPSPDAP
ncbi:MAG: hypothetical protein AABY22_12875 [Nanoarchaeota archaeon]